MICQKLDKVSINEEWINNLQSYCVFESGGCFDHLRCRIQFEMEEKKKRRPFKFTNIKARMLEFITQIESLERSLGSVPLNFSYAPSN